MNLITVVDDEEVRGGDMIIGGMNLIMSNQAIHKPRPMDKTSKETS